VLVIEADIARGRRLGLDVEQITLAEAHRLNPFLETEGVAAVMRVGDDMYFDPAQVAVGFARGAEARGVTLLPSTAVTSVRIASGRVEAVVMDKGAIETPVVVDAAGAWTRQVAAASGIHIPLAPTMQQLIVTEAVAGVRPDLPMVRIMDAAVYVRPCHGGFLWGVYKEEPTFFDMDELGPNFRIADLKLGAEILWRAAEDVKAQLPILLKAKVREHRGGLPTMTSDGHHIVGPAPGAKASSSLAAAMLPDCLSRLHWAARSPRGSAKASRRSTCRQCRSPASAQRRNRRLGSARMPLGSTGTSTGRYEAARPRSVSWGWPSPTSPTTRSRPCSNGLNVSRPGRPDEQLL
jgi:glycine/D-amino acid oxidase-like deaminating enzyme